MENLPIIIETGDEPEKVRRAAALVAEMLGDHGLVEVQTYRCGLKWLSRNRRSMRSPNHDFGDRYGRENQTRAAGT